MFILKEIIFVLQKCNNMNSCFGQSGINKKGACIFSCFTHTLSMIETFIQFHNKHFCASLSCEVNLAYEDQADFRLPYLITKILRQNRNSKTHQNTNT